MLNLSPESISHLNKGCINYLCSAVFLEFCTTSLSVSLQLSKICVMLHLCPGEHYFIILHMAAVTINPSHLYSWDYHCTESTSDISKYLRSSHKWSPDWDPMSRLRAVQQGQLCLLKRISVELERLQCILMPGLWVIYMQCVKKQV